MTDGLPLTVCIDCCVSLNQCSEFIEKTNQAQVSLRQLLIDPKSEPQPIEPNIDYVEETVELPKNESNNPTREEIVECQLPANYINETVNISNASYFIEDCKDESSQKYESQEMQDNTKQKKCKIQIKKNSPKQTKKRLKKKNQLQKMEESELHISSKIEKEQDEATVKDNMNVVDNYTPGKNLTKILCIRFLSNLSCFSLSLKFTAYRCHNLYTDLQ